MKVTSLIDNIGLKEGIPTEHGLSLLIELENGKAVLFDTGQSGLFALNATTLGLTVNDVDAAVISHGHYDHGGGLSTFLSLNSHAQVFIHRDAFMPHYSIHDDGIHYIGLDTQLKGHSQLILCDNLTSIDSGMTLFANVQGNCCNPTGNSRLLGADKVTPDTFVHEQNLIIKEGTNTVLFAGCAHRGIVNIMRMATEIIGHEPTHVFAGMHLMKSGLSESDESTFIHTLATELMKYNRCHFYTMHCTGADTYVKLRTVMGSQIDYLPCSASIKI